MRYKLLASASALILTALTATNAAAQNVETTDDGTENAIVVTGQRAQQVRAIAEKRDSLAIVDIASSDELGQLPDKNVAEAIERLPGVGVQYDQGEGRYVAVRGVPSSLNGYTLNGFEIGNPDGNTRSLPLDILSGQLLNRVEVMKVRTADLTGQGIGGTINLVTQTALDFDKPFVVQANAQIGYQELRDQDLPIKGDITVGGRFGADEEFGILLGASYSDRTFTSNGIYPDDWTENEAAARGAVPTNIKYTDYRLKRERIGVSGSLDWRSGATELFFRGVYSKFSEDEYRQRFRLDFSNITWDANGLTGIASTSEQRSDLRLEYKEKSLLSFMTGGSTEFADGWKADFGGAYTRNEVVEPNQVWQFRGNPGKVGVDFTDKLYTAVPVNGYLDASALGFRSYTAQDEYGLEETWQGRFDITGELPAIGMDSFLKFGANIRSTGKSFDSANESYSRGTSANRFTLADLAGENVTVHPKSGHPYMIAPTIDEDLIQAYTESKLGGPQFVFTENTSLANDTLSDFNLTEEVYAGYAMANLDFGQIGVTAGVRVEHTKLDITGYLLEGDTNVVPASGSREYTDWLPSIVARFKPAEDVMLRLAYSRAVGRPQYSDLSPGGSVTVESDDEISVSSGNPALKPYVADALDASAEWYFAPGGMLSIGAFAKWIKNPIFTQSFDVNDGTFLGETYDIIHFSQKQNAEKGDITGIELAYQQQFTMLPGLLSGFGVNLNLTLIDANLTDPTRGEIDFPEQSKLLWGAQLFYQKGIVEASVAYHHTGRALISAGDVALTDQFNDDLRRLDAKISLDLTENLRVFAEGQNLTDEPTRQYQGGVRDWVSQTERYGRTFFVGASVRF
ncbi:TonB-dependent receptor [Altererythrobacter sp. CC-YST694]|uniref:TonB-dependent receptor n=1 Tax=Altererythrobacter sp. CC-YST694 TaxID=2755038 RepID=UPI001D01BB0D|nr:TonB-dependent receptor [Altererythrobacter sp. CC-YST694]MCB5424467.1 TonB-dependent receptor [Altererythrobacter sp. CC-YST694]